MSMMGKRIRFNSYRVPGVKLIEVVKDDDSSKSEQSEKPSIIKDEQAKLTEDSKKESQ